MNWIKQLILISCLLGCSLATEKPTKISDIGLMPKLAIILQGDWPSHQKYTKNQIVMTSGLGVGVYGANLRIIPSVEHQVLKGLSMGIQPWGYFGDYLPEGYFHASKNHSVRPGEGGGWHVNNSIRYRYSSMFVNYRLPNWSIFVLKLELQYAHNALLTEDTAWAVRNGSVIVRPSIVLNMGILPWLAVSLESAAFNFAYKGQYDPRVRDRDYEGPVIEKGLWILEMPGIYVNVSF